MVTKKIYSDSVIITGGFTERPAKEFAALPTFCVMPFKAYVSGVEVGE